MAAFFFVWTSQYPKWRHKFPQQNKTLRDVVVGNLIQLKRNLPLSSPHFRLFLLFTRFLIRSSPRTPTTFRIFSLNTQPIETAVSFNEYRLRMRYLWMTGNLPRWLSAGISHPILPTRSLSSSTLNGIMRSLLKMIDMSSPEFLIQGKAGVLKMLTRLWWGQKGSRMHGFCMASVLED